MEEGRRQKVPRHTGQGIPTGQETSASTKDPKISVANSGLARALRNDAVTPRVLRELAIMRTAGVVVVQENSRDGRKQLYALAPNVPLLKTEKGAVLEFGFITVRL